MERLTPTVGNAAVRGAATSVVSQWGRFGVQFIGISLLAHLLSPSDFGVVSMVTAVVGIAGLVSDFGLSMATMQAREFDDQDRSNLFWTNVVLGVVFTMIGLSLSHSVAALYGSPAVVKIMVVLSPLFLLQALTTQFRANGARDMHYFRLGAIDVSAQIVGLGGAVAVVKAGGDYWGLVAQQLLVAVTTLVALAITGRWRPVRPRRRPNTGSLLRFGANASGVQLLAYISQNVDNVLLGATRGQSVLGVYAQAYQLFRLPLQQIAAPMTQVAVPLLSKTDSDAVFARYVIRAQIVLVYLLIGSFLTLAAIAHPLIHLFLGPGWGAVPRIFTILAFGGVFQVLGYIQFWIFVAKDLTGPQLRVSLVSRLCMVGLIVAGLPFGATGVAIGGSTGLLINWALLCWRVLPLSGISFTVLIRPTVPALVLFALEFSLARLVEAWLPATLNDVAMVVCLLGVCALVVVISCVGSQVIRRDLVTVWTIARRIVN